MRTITVRLLRQERGIKDAFSTTFAIGAPRALATFPWHGINGAELYIGQIYTNPPSWLPFLKVEAPNLSDGLFTGGAGAALFIPADNRMLAVCFGQIHIALNEDAFERQFGLRVTLNTVPRGKLRTLDLATPDAVTFQRRVQASKDSDLQAFGVDILRDLARVAGGTPSDASLGRFVAGKDSVSITCLVEPDTIHTKCSQILAAYRREDYRTEFAWIDHMRVVTEKDIVKDLDDAVFRALTRLRNGKFSDLHLAPPEVVNYTEGCELHYNGFGSHGTTFLSLSISDYVAELNRCEYEGDMVDVKARHRIKAKHAADEGFTEKWRVYDCFVFEATLGHGAEQKHYVLFAGSWYCVAKTFKDSVEEFFASIEKVHIIGATTCANEEDLIAEIDNSRDDLLKLDREKINPKGVRYANLEPCDFFSNNREFIHLKDGHSSGPISHLWAQGVVSAEALVSDAEFRKKLRSKVRSLGGGFESLLPLATEKLVRENYKVVFGIMRKPYADGTLGLPFFSKISLQAAVQRIQQFGIPVAIELIAKPASDTDAEGDDAS